ncbi:MAG: hypothetical protein GY882_02000 [Actinomycetia bacterium]|nr:hypothetical protein [Actinomycetes bacterium]MCP4845244.1 hypothetical protein [Actinomycetes bacterium]
MRILTITPGFVRRSQRTAIEDFLVCRGARRVDIVEVQRPDDATLWQLQQDLRKGRYDAIVLLYKTQREMKRFLRTFDTCRVPVYTADYAEKRTRRGESVLEFDGFSAAA